MNIWRSDRLKIVSRLFYFIALVFLLVAFFIALSPSDISYAATTCWSGGDVEICLTYPDSYSACPAGTSSDTISTSGAPDDWRLAGNVRTYFVTSGGLQLIDRYQFNENGDINITVTYPPASQWPLQADGRTRQIRVTIGMTVRDENGVEATKLNGQYDIVCLEDPVPTSTPVPPTPTDTPEGPTPTDTPVEPEPTDTPGGPTPTDTPVEPEPTDTPEGPTPTDTPVEPGPTDTPEEPTPTETPGGPDPTNTPEEPDPTDTPGGPEPTDTPIPPTATEPPGEPTPTVTPAEPGNPQIVDPKEAEVIDVNGNGYTDAGDEIIYSNTISNIGDADAEEVVFSDSPDPNTTIIPGSVETTAGTVTSGNSAGDTTVVVEIGTIAPGETVTVLFRVVINDPIPEGVTEVANQAIVVGGNFPDTPSNIVITPLGPPAGGAEDPADQEGTGAGSDVLIPETGISLSGLRNPRVRMLAQFGALCLGIGLVLQGLSLRKKSSNSR